MKNPKDKPLFVPLYKAYFLKFQSGGQTCEIRPNGYRGWNIDNVYPGRLITLSNGYGKKDRITKKIRSTMVTHDLRQEPVGEWHIQAVEDIYGKRSSWLIAYIE